MIKRFYPERIVKENPDPYGVDVIVENDQEERIANWEVGVAQKWINKFPYSEFRIPERKEKYCLLDEPTFFITWNKACTKYIIVNSLTVRKSPCTEFHNKYVQEGEYWFRIKLDKVLFGKVEEDENE